MGRGLRSVPFISPFRRRDLLWPLSPFSKSWWNPVAILSIGSRPSAWAPLMMTSERLLIGQDGGARQEIEEIASATGVSYYLLLRPQYTPTHSITAQSKPPGVCFHLIVENHSGSHHHGRCGTILERACRSENLSFTIKYCQHSVMYRINQPVEPYLCKRACFSAV